MEALINKLNSLNTATKESVSLLKGLFLKTEYRKGSLLESSPFRTSPILHYIHDGMAKGTVKHNGNTHIIWLMETGFIAPSDGFLIGNGIPETVEFLKESTVYSLDLFRADQLAKRNSGMYKMLLEIYVQSMIDGKRMVLMLKLNDAKERMDLSNEIDGNLVYNADRHTAASYLNISIRQLNRLKGGK
jgi:hypothetical protein